jgi:OST3/OST6 family protein
VATYVASIASNREGPTEATEEQAAAPKQSFPSPSVVTHCPLEMRFSTIMSASLMAIGALAAKQQPEQRFQEFHSKSLAASPVKLADSSFKKLTSTPRDYTAVVLLTAMDARYGCQLCREFQPEWDILAGSWTKGDKKGDSRVVFGTLDFADGRDTFMSVCILLISIETHFRMQFS